MNPLMKQHDKNFLTYIKNKFKLLVQKETIVSILFDESHLKTYFDSNDANIIGLSDNSNEAETNAFAFMLRNVF